MGRKGGKSLNPADQLRTLQGMERAWEALEARQTFFRRWSRWWGALDRVGLR